MRTAEAIVAGKKLITNTETILNEPFYNSKNVMLIDESVNINSMEIDDFIYGNTVELDESIVNDLSASNVFQSILNLFYN